MSGEKKDREWKNENLMEAFHRFRKLNFSGLFPELKNCEFATMKVIQRRSRKYPEKPVTVSAVAKVLGAPPSGVSRALRNLEERNLIRRSVDSTDRRNTMVELTEEGRQLMQKVEEVCNAFMDRVLAQVGWDEIDQVVDTMNRLYNVMQQELTAVKAGQKTEEMVSI